MVYIIGKEGYYMDKRKLLYGIWFILIMLTIGLRIVYVNSALWYDEACSWYTAKQDFPFGIIDNLLNLDLQHTPLYFFLLHFWMKIFGNGEIALKSLSLIPSALTIPLTYIIVRKLTSDKVLGFYASFAVAVSPLLVYFSTEVRMYPFVVFLVLLSINFLIDFNEKKDDKSLSKLVLTNVLIPYTLVGGILYNLSLAGFYTYFLHKHDKQSFRKYLCGILIETFALIPYFAMIFYYMKMRLSFVIRHEGALALMQVYDVIRNFFAPNTVLNVYWPDNQPIFLDCFYLIFVLLPCVYFITGFICGLKKSNGFLKTLYLITGSSFVLFIITAGLQLHVFTSRYILYLLIPIMILSLIGLKNKISIKHLSIFLTFFVLSSIVFDIKTISFNKSVKEYAFKTVKLEVDSHDLGINDIVIMPFGSDAPYYFRHLSDAQILKFDFHKEVRNPNNLRYYDEKSSRKIKEDKFQAIYDKVYENNLFSENYYNYLKEKISYNVPTGRYAVLALYSDDIKSLVPIEQIRAKIKSPKDVKGKEVEIMFEKYLYDLQNFLNQDFNFISSYQKNNYSYLIYQKK